MTRSFLSLLCVLCGEIGLAAEPGMVFIPGGAFSCGRSYDWPDTRLPWYRNPLKDDTPVRKIYIDPFYMDEAEVTNERYAAFVKATRHKPPYEWFKGEIPRGKQRHPVVNVSWDDAAAFCAWDGKRLPTEAEWERACRGVAEGRMYPWGNTNPTADQAVFNSDSGTAAVCAKVDRRLVRPELLRGSSRPQPARARRRRLPGPPWRLLVRPASALPHLLLPESGSPGGTEPYHRVSLRQGPQATPVDTLQNK